VEEFTALGFIFMFAKITATIVACGFIVAIGTLFFCCLMKALLDLMGVEL
jgi:hypothetical protein